MLYVCFARATKSENQAVGMEMMKGERIRGNHSAYDKGLLGVLFFL